MKGGKEKKKKRGRKKVFSFLPRRRGKRERENEKRGKKRKKRKNVKSARVDACREKMRFIPPPKKKCAQKEVRTGRAAARTRGGIDRRAVFSRPKMERCDPRKMRTESGGAHRRKRRAQTKRAPAKPVRGADTRPAEQESTENGR